jgi:predicted membrane-bound mannosyltransferase
MNRDQVGPNLWAEKGITICIMIGILLLALSLRLSGLGAKCVWVDEIYTAAIASTEHGISQVLTIPLYNSAIPTPPLYFLITHFFLHIGDNDFLLRFSALFLGVLGVPITYALGVRLLGKREGLSGAFLLSLATLHIRYSQDARFYTLLMVLSLLSLYFLYRGVFDKERKWWVGFTVCSILNVYSHLFAFLVLLAEMVFVAGLWLAEALLAMGKLSFVKQTTDSGKSVGTFDKHSGLDFVVSLTVIALAYTPMFPHLLRGSSALGGSSLPPGILMRTLDAWGVGSGWAILVLLIPFLVGMIISAKALRRQLWLAFCWLVVPFGVLFAVPAEHGFRPRYVLFMLPLYLLFAAKGMTATSKVINARLPGGGVAATRG